MSECTYLIKEMPSSDAPILNALLRSRVFLGKTKKEKITCTHFDKNDKKVKVSWTFTCPEKLDQTAFEYYARCLKIINLKNERTLTLTTKEFKKFAGISNKVFKSIEEKIDDFLNKVIDVKASYKIHGQKKKKTFHLMYAFSYDEDNDEIKMSFSEQFIAASKLLYIKHFDVDMYRKLNSPHARTLMYFLEAFSLTESISTVKVKKRKLVSRLNIIKTGKQGKQQEGVAIMRALEILKKKYFIVRYEYHKTGIHRADPFYTIIIQQKDQRTVERDIAHKMKQLDIERQEKEDARTIDIEAEARKRYDAQLKKRGKADKNDSYVSLFDDDIPF